MPVYIYECGDCGRRNEYLVNMGERPYECADCGSETLERVLEGQTFTARTGGVSSEMYRRSEIPVPEAVIPLTEIKISGIGNKITDVSAGPALGIVFKSVNSKDN